MEPLKLTNGNKQDEERPFHLQILHGGGLYCKSRSQVMTRWACEHDAYMKLIQQRIFCRVSVCPQGGRGGGRLPFALGDLPLLLECLQPPWADIPYGQTSFRQTPPGKTQTLGRNPPWADTPPQGRWPPGRHPSGQTPPCPMHAGIHTPSAECMFGYTPTQCMLGYTSPLPSACWDMVNKWVVCIPPEWILVTKKSFREIVLFYSKLHHDCFLTKIFLTLSAPALQTYVNHPDHMWLKFHFSKSTLLPWLTIVLLRIAKENLSFCDKKWRVHYNSPQIMCYPLDQNIFYSLTEKLWIIPT